MKCTPIFIITFSLFSIFLSAQDSKTSSYPNSIVTASAGLGPNYGVFGIKTVTGYKNSGLLLSAGRLDDFTTFTIGAQLAVDWWYLSVGYGCYGLYIRGTGSSEQKELMKGVITMTGAMINLGKEKRFFIDTGIGFSTGHKIEGNVFIEPRTETMLSIALGIGYRIGG